MEIPLSTFFFALSVFNAAIKGCVFHKECLVVLSAVISTVMTTNFVEDIYLGVAFVAKMNE